MRRWLALTLLLAAASMPASAQVELAWAPAETTLAPGDVATLSILLADTVDVRTLEVRIQFDPDLIASLDGQPGALFQGFNLFEDFEDEGPGQWHGYAVILGAYDWLTGPGELYRWDLQALADVEGVSDIVTVDVVALQPDATPFPEGVVLPGTWIQVGDVVPGVEGPPAAPGTGLLLSPNPFNPRVRIVPVGDDGRLGTPGLAVLDLRGRRVGALGPPGTDGWTWAGRDAAGRDLPSGVYTFVLLDAGRPVAQRRGVLVR